MEIKNKFDLLFEETLQRFQQNGLLEGDYVKLIKNYRKNDKIKSRGEPYLERLDYLFKSNVPLKLSAIKAERTESTNGVVGSADAPTGFWADIIQEHAPGLWTNVTTVPLEILEKIETGNSFSPGVPESNIRKDTTQIKPNEVKQANSNYNLPGQNITIKS
jgi:hypothetical protein